MVPGVVAAALSGLLVGLVAVALTTGGMETCEAARGTSSCGRGPGFVLLLAVVAAMVAVGAGVLRALRQPAPLGTSLLGAGLLVVVVLALADHVFAPWMAAAVPLLAATSYVVGRRVVSYADEPARE